MTLRFRNVNVDVSDPVESWPLEAVATAIERGGLSHWRRLLRAVQAEPWGAVARNIEAALDLNEPYGTGPLLRLAVEAVRERAKASEREEVKGRVERALQSSGLTQSQFAEAIGTSASRFSTYLRGSVVPSAALLVRMERLAQRRARRCTEGQDPHVVGGASLRGGEARADVIGSEN